MEISYIELGDTERKHPETTDAVLVGETVAITTLSDYTLSSEGEHVHTTVGVRANYDCKKHDSKDLSSDEMADIIRRTNDSECFLLPDVCKSAEILTRISNISKHFLLGEPYNKVVCLSKWFELVGHMTKICLDELCNSNRELSSSAKNYVYLAKEYIVKNFNKRLKVSDIALEIAISESHLHRVFKQSSGCSIVEYINKVKVDAAKAYTELNGVSEQEAATYVGIDDSAYFSRVFKKYTGMSFSEYRKHYCIKKR